MIDSLIRAACSALTLTLPEPRRYVGKLGPYLTRWPLLALPRGARLSLHYFHRSDEDQELHTHPWSWAAALQLAGGYTEERRDGLDIVTRVCPPGSLVLIWPDTAHRVDLLDPDGSWSLILTGPVVSSWGFYDRVSWDFTPWREFVERKGVGRP